MKNQGTEVSPEHDCLIFAYSCTCSNSTILNPYIKFRSHLSLCGTESCGVAKNDRTSTSYRYLHEFEVVLDLNRRDVEPLADWEGR